MECGNGREVLPLRVVERVGGVAGLLRRDMADLLAWLGRPVRRRERESTVCACVQWPRLKQETALEILLKSGHRAEEV